MDRFGLAHRISRKQDRLLDRLRDRRTDAAAGLPGTADSFAAPGPAFATRARPTGSAGMAAFLAMMPCPGDFTDEYFALPEAERVAVGMATDGR